MYIITNILSIMPLPYSSDLRWRVVWQHVFLGKKASSVAKLMRVSTRTVYRYAERFSVTGDVKLFAKKSGPDKEVCDYEKHLIVQLVLSNPGIFLKEISEAIYNITMHWISEATVCRTLRRIGMSRQKMKHFSLVRSESRRKQYLEEMSYLQPEMIVWIDETGCELRNSFRKYGYGLRGLPPQTFHLKLRGKHYSAICILSTEGVEDVYICEEGVTGDVFLDFVRKCLLPILQPFNGQNPNSVVVLDNASVHHVDSVIQTIQSVGALVRFLPPYSPDLNPIEEVFSEVKCFLQANMHLFEATSNRTMILMAFASVSTYKCNSYIAHSGHS